MWYSIFPSYVVGLARLGSIVISFDCWCRQVNVYGWQLFVSLSPSTLGGSVSYNKLVLAPPCNISAGPPPINCNRLSWVPPSVADRHDPCNFPRADFLCLQVSGSTNDHKTNGRRVAKGI